MIWGGGLSIHRVGSSGFFWSVIWISLLIDVLKENLIHSIEIIFGDYKICIFTDEKVPCHRSWNIECHMYHSDIHVQNIQWSVQFPWSHRKCVVCHPQNHYNKTDFPLNVNLSAVLCVPRLGQHYPHHMRMDYMTRCPSGSGISWTTIYISPSMRRTICHVNIMCIKHISTVCHMFDLLVVFSRGTSLYVHFNTCVTFHGIRVPRECFIINIRPVPLGHIGMWRSLLSRDSRVVCSRAS